MDSPPPPGAFAATRWTLVLRARGETPPAQAALGELCTAYYAPVLAFIRRGARDEETARDLTQEFFARLLARRGLDTVEPGRGRFRSFLLGAVKHFLSDMRDREQAARRGGGQEHVSLDAGTDTSPGSQAPAAASPPPELIFDRQWALTLLERALAKLSEEFASAGKAVHFETLKPWLTGEIEGLSQAEAAVRLGLNEGAVKVAIHRLRARFRELMKTEIAETLDDPARLEEELRYLIEVLA